MTRPSPTAPSVRPRSVTLPRGAAGGASSISPPSARREPRSRGRAGFTLVEVLIAVSILAVVSAMVFASFHQTFKAKAVIEAGATRYHSVRLAMERISRELSMAYLSQNEDPAQQDRRTFFIGKRKGDIDELRFSMLGHQRLYADSNEADTAQVAWFGSRDREDGSRMNLIHRETRRLGYGRPEQAAGESGIACDDVVRFKLDYWDGREKTWREEWSTLAADGQADRLPAKVRITLTVKDSRDEEIPFTTEVRIPLQEPLNPLNPNLWKR